MPKRLGAACEQDDLHPLRGVRENVRHHLEAIIVREDERVVKHDRHRSLLVEEQICKRQPGQDRELFLGAAAERMANL